MAQFLTLDQLDVHLQRAKPLQFVDQPTEKIMVPDEPEATTHMIFTCMSHSPEAVKQCMEESGLIYLEAVDFVSVRSSISVFFPDDTMYPQLQAWASDAYGCGLISLPYIER